MKLKLGESGRKKQDAIHSAIRRGLSLAGMIAAGAISTGCGDADSRTPSAAVEAPVSGENRPVQTVNAAPDPQSEKPLLTETAAPECERKTLPGMLPEYEERPAAKPETAVYTVKSGDNLTKIAHAYGVTVDELKRLNNFSGTQTDRLKVGQSITVPGGKNQGNENTGERILMGKPSISARKK